MEEASYGWTDEGKKGFFLFFFLFIITRNLFALSLMFLLFLLHFSQADFFFFFYLVQNVAFVLDPDGYWIEVIQNEKYKAAPGKY